MIYRQHFIFRLFALCAFSMIIQTRYIENAIRYALFDLIKTATKIKTARFNITVRKKIDIKSTNQEKPDHHELQKL